MPGTQTAPEELIVARAQSIEMEFGCRIGLIFKEADGSQEVRYRGEELFHAASTMKVPVMIEVFREAEQGVYTLKDPVAVNPWFKSMIDGSPYECDAREYLTAHLNQEVPMLALVEQMITVSDNLATNLLITRCTPQRITATMRSLGARNGFVIRCLQDEEAYEAGISNRISANDLAALLQSIEEGTASSPEMCEEMKRILLEQKYNELIPALLPKDVKVAHKTGNITGINHDAAIVYTPDRTYYLVILTDGFTDSGIAAEQISRLALFVHDMTNSPTSASKAGES